MSQNFEFLCDALALLYHEARNVRHLVRAGYLPKEPWSRIISLPVNREEAWLALENIRDQALSTESVEGALNSYRTHFGNSVDELRTMFGNANWAHAKSRGGNAWVEISSLTSSFAEALLANSPQAEDLKGQLRATKHNTGSVIEKLDRLKALRKHSGG